MTQDAELSNAETPDGFTCYHCREWNPGECEHIDAAGNEFCLECWEYLIMKGEF